MIKTCPILKRLFLLLVVSLAFLVSGRLTVLAQAENPTPGIPEPSERVFTESESTRPIEPGKENPANVIGTIPQVKDVDLTKIPASQMEKQLKNESSGLKIEKDKENEKEPSSEKLLPKQLPPKPSSEEVVGTQLPLFGYEVFQRFGRDFTPSGKGPMGPDYIVGPGDSFEIYIWGQEEASLTAEINQNGELLLPRIGPVSVGGLALGELKESIKRAVGSRFRDFELTVVPAKQRKNRIYILGEVSYPGVYDIEGFATAYTALFAAGGPTQRGSLRAIDLKRGNRKVATIDLYDFLMSGNRTTDVPLQDGDVLFVPLIGPVVSVGGAVKRPASYELKEGELSLEAALSMAGGIGPTGITSELRLDRIVSHSRRSVLSLKLPDLDLTLKQKRIDLQNLDIIHVFSISPRDQEMVLLEGHVFEPGLRPWHKGMKVSELIDSPGKLKKDPYLEFAEIYREYGPGGQTRIIHFHPGKVLEKAPGDDIELHPRDRILIRAASEVHEKPSVNLLGEVVNPGPYPLIEGLTVKDLVLRAGGLRLAGNRKKAELSRRVFKDGKTEYTRIEINLEKALKDDPRENLPLQAFDHLLVPLQPDWQGERLVTITGEVAAPGIYPFQPGERLSSVLKRAGGFNERAYPKAARFERKTVLEQQRTNLYKIRNYAKTGEQLRRVRALNREEGERGDTGSLNAIQGRILEQLDEVTPTGRMVIHLSADPSFEGSTYDFPLENGDVLTVPQQPSMVLVDGAVVNPTSFVWEPKKSVAYFLKQAGGVARHGDSGEIYLVRADGTILGRNNKPWRCFASTVVEPGDAIWVPANMRPLPMSSWKQVTSLTQILSNIALTAFAIESAGK